MKRKTIIFTSWLETSKEHQRMLAENTELEIQYKKVSELTPQDYQETEIIIGGCEQKLLKKFKNLKWLQLQSAGTDGYTDEGILPARTLLTNATGTYGLTIAEHMLAMTMLLQRKFHHYFDNQKQELWKSEGDIQSIYNSVFLIIGLGDIGTEFAKRVKALGGYTIGVKRVIYGDEKHIDELYTNQDLDEQIARADVIAMSVPGTPETFKMWDKDRIAKMKENAIFINVGRGISVDTEALCDALENKKIGGASLDVIDPEPLPVGHRAWKTPNLIITPHISGNYYLEETKNRFLAILKENITRYLEGKPLLNEVDFKTGYRKKNF